MTVKVGLVEDVVKSGAISRLAPFASRIPDPSVLLAVLRSILLIFGYIRLVLGTYQDAEVDLQAGECVLIDPKVKYQFKSVPGSVGLAAHEVSMVSCFFQKQVHEHLHSAEPSERALQVDTTVQ